MMAAAKASKAALLLARRGIDPGSGEGSLPGPTLLLELFSLFILGSLAPMSPSSPATPAATALSDTEYQARTRAVLDAIEAQVDQWLDSDWIDIDTHRSGGLLEMSFPDRSKIIINTQAPLQELWLAAKAGGFHYRFVAGQLVGHARCQ